MSGPGKFGAITFGGVKHAIRRLLAAVAWLGLMSLIGLGAAGIVNAMDHQPGTPSRAELTSVGDAEVQPMLDAATGDLVALSDQVSALGVQARGALAALNGSDSAVVDAAIADGDRLVQDLQARTSALRGELAAVPYVATPIAPLLLSDAVVARHAALTAALDATEGLDANWLRLTLGSVSATRMSALLARHDTLVVQAAAQGRVAKYAAAAGLLDQADATIAEARQLRDQLANTVDVTVLDQWLERNAAYDAALRNLYTAIATVSGKVTDSVRTAIAAERAAKEQLPPDTRGLVVIMAEIGRGGMNGAVIAIEEARGKLTSAIDAAQAGAAERADGAAQPGAGNAP
ncbi:MAG: hypothetical protein QOJ75_2232 [Chloroflexota bacterium]|jgi:hypothetical protein|nr:hypothetical protein [Chloroflexota bacterium]